MIGELKVSPKRFRSLSKCAGGSRGQLCVILDDGVKVTGDTERANLLNRAFAYRLANPDVCECPVLPSYDLPLLNRSLVTEDSVRCALNELERHEDYGPDNV